MNDLVYVGNAALMMTIKLSAVPVALATIIGVLVGLFQTVFQIQEQTLPFGLKMLVVFISLFALSPWYSEEMFNYTRQTFMVAFH